MSEKLLAKRYLDAFANCYQQQEVSQKLEVLNSFILNLKNDNVLDYLVAPSVSFLTKKELVSKLVPKKETILFNFIMLIITKNRSVVFRYFEEGIAQKKAEIESFVNAHVFCSTALDTPQERIIINFLNNKFNKKVNLNTVIDESIVAGFKIEVENNVYDLTLSSSLNKLKSSFK
tara:strand:+ start:633 stop:1157 length:525 start_codon:yes stop_codon:yes gene_type:complete